MACDISLGRVEPCKDSLGGLDAVYFINDADLSITDLTFDSTNTDAIEAVTGSPTAYKYDLKGNSSFEQTIVSSRDNGTTYFEQALNLTLKKQDVTTHKEIKLLSYGNPKVIVKDNNGNFFLAGAKFGMDVTGGTVTSGAAMGDLNGYTLVLTGMEPAPAYFFEATTEAALISAGVTIVSGVAS
jgi:hypothetical protein